MNPAAMRLRLCSLLAATAGLALLTGCGMGSQSGPLDTLTPQIVGVVRGGQNPVSFGHIALFATTSAAPTGSAAPGTLYGNNLTPIATTTSDTNGNFSFTSGFACPAGQQAYLVSTGGNPGLTATTDNSAIFLVAALGPCSGLGAVGIVTVNEVTTVAAAYALGGFAPAGGAGMTESAITGGTALPGITTSSTNVQGLSDGFANAANIVSINTGNAYTTSPTGGVVPQSMIHALADILQSCVNSAAPSSAACSALFAAAQPPVTGSVKPVNVWQAALDIAAYPGNNAATLFGLISPQPAFPESLTVAPNDWTVAVSYTYGTSVLVSGLGLGIDAFDSVYITGSTAATSPNGTDLIAISPQGSLISSSLMSATATTNNIRWIAFDKSGDAYMANGNDDSIYKFVPTTAGTSAAYGGTLTKLSYASASVTTNNYALAVDQLGDVWVDSYKKSTCSTTAPLATNSLACWLIEYPVSAQTAPVATFVTSGTNTVSDLQPGVAGGRSVAFDVKTNNVWTTDIGGATLNVFNVTPSASGPATASGGPKSYQLGTAPNPTAGYGSVAVAIDANSNAWGVVTGGTGTPAALYQVTPSGTVTAIPGLTPATGGGLVVPAYDVIDGNGNIFIANTGASSSTSTIAEYSPSAAAYLSPGFGYSPGATYTAVNGATAASISGGLLYQSGYVAVDRSGALWTFSSGNGTTHPSNVVQILGVAAPTDPVQADGNYGVKP